MGFRTVNGNQYTEDGWRCCNRDECDVTRIPGLTLVDTAPLRRGAPLTILGAWLFWYDRNVEEITSSVWGWSESNDVLGQPGLNNGSNHLSATAVDVNAPRYPWGTYRMPADKIAKVEEGLRLFPAVFWGRVWSKPDEMHYQMRWPEGDPRNEEFAQKLLGGYLGIYKAGPPAPPPPPPAVMTVPLVQNANGTWTSPSPAWAHLIRRESGGNPTIIQQIHDVNSGGNEAEGLFQITPRTWRAHHGDEFAPSPRLAAPQQQAIVAARIFTRNPSGSDWGAGLPGRENANQLAAGLVPTTTQAQPPPVTGDDMALVPQDQWDRVYRELTDLRISRSPLREPDEGPKDTWSGFLLNTDGSQHLEVCKILAGYGHPPTIALLKRVAAMDPNKPGREGDCYIAQAILAEATTPPAATTPPQPDAAPVQPQVVYLPAPAPVAAPIVADESDTGQAIGDLFKVLQRLRLADALPIETRAPLAALISVLNTKNGSAL